jgi:predicted secreted hydrolase
MRRRQFVAASLGVALWRHAAAEQPVVYPAVSPGTVLQFPRDHGAHPDYRVEWWYLSGWLDDAGGQSSGFQITFFRLRPGLAENNPSRFAPRQLLFAHAALATAGATALRHDQRAARAGTGAAFYSEDDTALRIRDWSLARQPDGGYEASIQAASFSLALSITPRQPLLLQGESGFSRKGPELAQASYYYSLPQLAVRGELAADGRTHKVSGVAWLDHEWSSAMLASHAVGWDWTAINLDGGDAMMAFRIRDAQGAAIWAGGAYRRSTGETERFAPEQIVFTPQRRWRSPRTGAEYPVEMDVQLGDVSARLVPLLDDQELDTRRTVGAVYWEGAVRATAVAPHGAAPMGRGYLEFTGYASPLRF